MIINSIKKVEKAEFLKFQESYINYLTEYHVHYLNGQMIKEEKDYLSYFKDVYNFPSYYGNNVAAFSDCMGDLDFRAEQGFILIIYNFSNFMENFPRDKEIFISVLGGIAFYLEKECLTTSGGRNHLKSFDVYLIDESLENEYINNIDMKNSTKMIIKK